MEVKTREPKCSYCPTKSTAISMSMREHRLAKQRMGHLENDHILAFGEVFETSLTSWNSFNVCFAILHTVCCTWPAAQKHMHTYMCHLLVQRSLRCVQGLDCEYVHLVMDACVWAALTEIRPYPQQHWCSNVSFYYRLHWCSTLVVLFHWEHLISGILMDLGWEF